jgi:hypothetical protein
MDVHIVPGVKAKDVAEAIVKISFTNKSMVVIA